MNSRRGAALLMAMVAMVLVSTVLASLFVLQGERVRLHVDGSRDREMIALLREAEDLAAGWCAAQGPGMVLAPEDAHRGLVILDDAVEHHGRVHHVTIQIFDGLGGVPVGRTRPPQPLSGWRPMGWQDAVIPPPADPRHGETDVLERVDVGQLARFPATAGPAGRPDALLPLSLWLMPHAQGRVNVHTLPPALLRDLFNALGRDDADEILERRRVGERLSAEELGRGLKARVFGIRLVGESDVWQSLITVRVGGHTRRWWTVLRMGEHAVERVQRHACG